MIKDRFTLYWIICPKCNLEIVEPKEDAEVICSNCQHKFQYILGNFAGRKISRSYRAVKKEENSEESAPREPSLLSLANNSKLDINKIFDSPTKSKKILPTNMLDFVQDVATEVVWLAMFCLAIPAVFFFSVMFWGVFNLPVDFFVNNNINVSYRLLMCIGLLVGLGLYRWKRWVILEALFQKQRIEKAFAQHG